MKKLKEYQTKKTKIIVFDFDGVLAETIKIKGDVFYDTFYKYGKKIQQYARKFHLSNIGLSREYKFKEILNFSEKQNNNKILKEINLNFISIYNRYKKKIKINKILFKFILNNDDKYLFYIASAAPKKEIIDILRYNGLHKKFTAIYGSPIKKEDSIRKILKDNKFKNKENLIFIGDSIHDYLVAKKLNLNFIAYKLEIDINKRIKVLKKSNQFTKIVNE
ncbi:HAD hydrolase-like protein, partial [Alphaproteobacteria bacterium]|nr:HAD hydrolase-like protein [Alphaproteobacteria bacterium]